MSSTCSPLVCEHPADRSCTAGIGCLTADECSPSKVDGPPDLNQCELCKTSPISTSSTSPLDSSFSLETCDRLLTTGATSSLTGTSMVVTIMGSEELFPPQTGMWKSYEKNLETRKA